MTKKKESRKAEPGEERFRKFLKNLEQYNDFNSTSFDNFPRNLPRNFPIKLGEAVIGKVSIDWHAVLAKFFDTTAMSKPEELSDDEYTQQLKALFASFSSKELTEVMLPLYSTVLHMVEYMPQKLSDAVTHLSLEGRQNILIRRGKESGSKNIPSAAKFAAWITKIEEEATKGRLPEVRGGKDPKIEVSDEQCVRFSTDYPVLLQHWQDVKRWHKRNPSGNWREHAKVDQSDTPDELLDKLCGLDPYEGQPAVLAHEHAARRCGIPNNTYSLSNLSRFRRRGDKLTVNQTQGK